MTIWTEAANLKQLDTPVGLSNKEIHVGNSVNKTIIVNAQRAGNTYFGTNSKNSNVAGYTVNKGGNGSNRSIVPKKIYYWHL